MGSQRVGHHWVTKHNGTVESLQSNLFSKNSGITLLLLFSHCAVLSHSVMSNSVMSDSMDCSPPDPSVHGDSSGKNTGVGCHALLQGIFPTQGLNLGPHTKGRFFTV